ncbi:MAG: hypothetical protein Q8R63_02135 [Ramlibacter sp.]|nr:hypothetical protein [Ramlibacter sp.]
MTRRTAPRLFCVLLALAAAGIVSACQTSSLEELAPVAGARNTGTTPNLNIAPTAETAQLTEEQKNAKIAELRAAQSNQGVKAGRPGGQTSAAQMRKIGQSQAETLKDIEAGE